MLGWPRSFPTRRGVEGIGRHRCRMPPRSAVYGTHDRAVGSESRCRVRSCGNALGKQLDRPRYLLKTTPDLASVWSYEIVLGKEFVRVPSLGISVRTRQHESHNVISLERRLFNKSSWVTRLTLARPAHPGWRPQSSGAGWAPRKPRGYISRYLCCHTAVPPRGSATAPTRL